jgi:hypothetical protein
MPRLIQTAPIALLSTLTSKDGGIGPAALLDEVRGIVDLLPYYGLNFRRSRFVFYTKAQINAGGGEGWNYTALIGGAGAANLVVPDGQVWRIFGMNVNTLNNLGTTQVQAAWTMKDPNLGGSEGIPIGQCSQSAAANTRVVSGGECNLWALPGACASFHIRDWLLATNDFDVQLGVDYEVYSV